MSFKGLLGLGVSALMLAVLSFHASAHHSYAVFDRDTSIRVEGTVKQFRWTNPHSWVILSVKNDDGQVVDWPIEMGSPRNLATDGWTPKTLTPGMDISVLIHPLKEAEKPGGQLMVVTLPDGTELGDHAPPSQ